MPTCYIMVTILLLKYVILKSFVFTVDILNNHDFEEKKIISRYKFPGSITAYGAGNSDNLNSVKAGAGTIYIKDNTRGVPNEKLIIAGNTVDPLQRQTRTMITGSQFQFAEVTLKGMRSVPL